MSEVEVEGSLERLYHHGENVFIACGRSVCLSESCWGNNCASVVAAGQEDELNHFVTLLTGSRLEDPCSIIGAPSDIRISKPFRIRNLRFTIQLVSVPEFKQREEVGTNIRSLNSFAAFLATLCMTCQRLIGIIFLHSIQTPRLGLTGSYLAIMPELCGSGWPGFALVTTKWQHDSPQLVQREVDLQKKFLELTKCDALELGPFWYARLDDHAFAQRKNSMVAVEKLLIQLLTTNCQPLLLYKELSKPETSLTETTFGSKLLKELENQWKDMADDPLDDILEEVLHLEIATLDLLLGPYSPYGMSIGKARSELAVSMLHDLDDTLHIIVFADSEVVRNEFNQLLIPNMKATKMEHTFTRTEPIFLESQKISFIHIPSYAVSMEDEILFNDIAINLVAMCMHKLRVVGLLYLFSTADVTLSSLQHNLRMLKATCGDKTFKNLALTKSIWTTEEKNSGDFAYLAQCGAEFMDLPRSSQSAEMLVYTILQQAPPAPNILPLFWLLQEVMVKKMPFSETTAGLEISNLLEQKFQQTEKALSQSIHDNHGNFGKELNASVGREWKIKNELLRVQIFLVRHSGAYNVFSTLLEEFSSNAHLEKAIQHLETTLIFIPDGHPDKCHKTASLGSLYSAHFKLFGDKQDLQDAIKQYDYAVEHVPLSDPQRPTYLLTLSQYLEQRFQLFGGRSDILKAIQHCQEAAQMLSANTPLKKAFALHALGALLKQKFQTFFDNVEDINNAILNFRNAIFHLPSGNAAGPIIFGDLCTSHLLRSKYYKMKGLPTVQEATESAMLDIDIAIEEYNKMQPYPSPNHPAYCMLQNAKCQAYTKHYKLQRLKKANSKYAEDIGEAILAGEQAIKYSHHTAQECTYLFNLGKAYFYQYEDTSDSDKLEEAILCYQSAAQCEAARLMTRFKAAKNWAKSAEKHKDQKSIMTAYKYCISLLPKIAGEEWSIEEQQRRLKEIGGIVYKAVSTAIVLKKTETAVEWFEEGRSIVWNRHFHQNMLLQELSRRNPELAREYERCSVLLQMNANQESNSQTYMDTLSNNPLATKIPWQQANSPHELVGFWQSIVKKIKGIPSFKDFLLPKQLAAFKSAAKHGPVIMINISNTSCDALILQFKKTQIVHLNLPISLKRAEQMQIQLNRLLAQGGLKTRGMGSPNAAYASLHNSDFSQILSELWANIVEPIVNTLNQKSSPKTSLKPRIFWCASGPLAFLPLHAAGIHPIGKKLSDSFVSSYAPSLQALQQSPPQKTDFYLLAVAQSMGIGPYPALPKTLAEVASIKSFSQATVSIQDKEATLKNILEKIKKCSWVHFACHGMQDSVNPLKSSLLLYNNEHLSLKEIINLNLEFAEFAFLSACQTAMGDTDLPEESVHIAAGMLVAGYQGVVATLWSIQDQDGPIIAKEFYQYMFRNKEVEKPDYTEAAFALHQAVEKLRQQKSTQFLDWVPFIHVGI